MTASWLVVARKDVEDAVRSRMLLALVVIYSALVSLVVGVPGLLQDQFPVEAALWLLTIPSAFIVPLLALVASYLAIAGERESGGIKYLLSIPNARRDVVLGKFITRTVIVSASIVVAFLVSAVLTLLWYPDPRIDVFGVMMALTVLYALTYVAVAIGISAATASRSRAMGGSIAFFFATSVLNVLGPLQLVIDYVANDLAGLEISMNQIAFVQSLVSPTAAYVNSTGIAFPEGFNTIPEELPWFLQGETMIVVMLGWLVVPLALGIWQFERADLG